MIIGGNPGQAKSTLRSCASEKCTQRGQALRHISNTAVGRPACARDAEPPSSFLFSVLQALLILSALQPSIFSVLASGGQIACSPPFSSKIRSQGKHMGFPSLFQDGQEGEVREERILDWK